MICLESTSVSNCLLTGVAPDHIEILQTEKESRDRSGPKRSRFSYEQLIELSPVESAAESTCAFLAFRFLIVSDELIYKVDVLCSSLSFKRLTHTL